MKKVIALLLSLVMVMSLASFASAEGGKVMNLFLGGGTPLSMDPALNSASAGSNIIRSAFTGLMGYQLENGEPVMKPELAESVEISEDEQPLLDELTLLTAKPVIYACNMSEEDFVDGIDTNVRYNAVKEIAAEEGSQVLPICAEMEAEIASLSKEEKTEFLSDLGIEQGGLDLLIQRSYDLLGLMSFLTAGEPEVRAWTIKKGTKAPQAAGKIHSDIERGFIRAEVINYKLLLECGSTAAAREKGLIRSEGKEYIMQDGDVVLFRFNV